MCARNSHVSIVMPVLGVILVEWHIDVLSGVWWPVIKPVVQHKLDETGCKQVQLLYRNELLTLK